VRFLERLGEPILRTCQEFGRFFILLGRTAVWALRPPYDLREIVKQMVRVGVESIPVVFLTGLFTGMVIALQTFKGFARFHAENYVGSVISVSVLRELAPVLAALMVTGRVGSAMAAELGTMRVTEQIDALIAFATQPVQYLFVPRVVASVVMLPLLVVMADAVGIGGGYLVAVGIMHGNPVAYIRNSFEFLQLNDFTSGIIKAAVFGLIFSLIGCQKGYDTKGGAEGVGISTTQAVVAGSLSILLADFFLTKILY
jgi:phospholipid/cholesterol/gamma-HCH transport system permease protein